MIKIRKYIIAITKVLTRNCSYILMNLGEHFNSRICHETGWCRMPVSWVVHRPSGPEHTCQAEAKRTVRQPVSAIGSGRDENHRGTGARLELGKRAGDAAFAAPARNHSTGRGGVARAEAGRGKRLETSRPGKFEWGTSREIWVTEIELKERRRKEDVYIWAATPEF